jgi:hypothetical protein
VLDEYFLLFGHKVQVCRQTDDTSALETF